MNLKKRKKNELAFGNWIETAEMGRVYWFELKGKHLGKARYVNEVDQNEITLKFFQEIYNDKNVLIEIHLKYPKDTGHQKMRRNGNHKR